MIREETIKHFESLQKRYTTQHNGKHCEYVKEALEAMRKQIPQKPIIKKSIIVNGFALRCPYCESVLQSDSPHCKYCGQALDWSDV